MAIISNHKNSKAFSVHNSQLRYAIVCVVITTVTLYLLNFISASTIRNKMYDFQKSVLERARGIAASFSDIDSVNAQTAQQIVESIEKTAYDRIVVTDYQGIALYDSREVFNETGKQFLLPWVVQALDGKDVLDSHIQDGALICSTGVPIAQNDIYFGAVYLMVCDQRLGSILHTMEQTVLLWSIVLELLVITFSAIFSVSFARKMRRIMEFIHIVREGDYANKIELNSNDEMEHLAMEFNDLTDRLQLSEQRRRQFVSDASHELKTPLASIKLLSDSILQNDMDAETIREFVGDIGNEADRLTRMSQKLLELNKLDAMTEEECTPVDVRQVAQKVFRMLQPQMAAKKIRLKDKSISGCVVLITEDDLYQILFNLVENGIKYNVKGGLLRFTMKNEAQRVTFSLEDSGVGIPEESLDKIFDRFYRVDKARSRKAGGSGLGLSIVHDKVVRNHGTVRAENRPSGGTCFTVEFPCYDGKGRKE